MKKQNKTHQQMTQCILTSHPIQVGVATKQGHLFFPPPHIANSCSLPALDLVTTQLQDELINGMKK